MTLEWIFVVRACIREIMHRLCHSCDTRDVSDWLETLFGDPILLPE
jgi:hypothetical protein